MTKTIIEIPLANNADKVMRFEYDHEAGEVKTSYTGMRQPVLRLVDLERAVDELKAARGTRES